MKKRIQKILVVVVVILLVLLLKSCQLRKQLSNLNEPISTPNSSVVKQPEAEEIVDTILNGNIEHTTEEEDEIVNKVILLPSKDFDNEGSDTDEVVIIEEQPPEIDIPEEEEVTSSSGPAEAPSEPVETKPSSSTTNYKRPSKPAAPAEEEPPIEEEPSISPSTGEEVPAEPEPPIEEEIPAEEEDDILKDLQDKLDEALKALENAEGDEEKAKENLKDIFENADDSELEEFIDRTQEYLSAVNNKSSIEIIDILTSVIELGGFGEDLFNENGTLSSTDTSERAHVIHDIMEYIEFVAEEETGDYTFLISSSDGNYDIYFVADSTNGKDNVENVLIYNVNDGSWAIGSMNVNEDGSLDSDSYYYYDSYWERYMFDSLDDLKNELVGSNDIAQEEFEDSIINSDEYQEALGELDQATENKGSAQEIVDNIQEEIDSLLGESSKN